MKILLLRFSKEDNHLSGGKSTVFSFALLYAMVVIFYLPPSLKSIFSIFGVSFMLLILLLNNKTELFSAKVNLPMLILLSLLGMLIAVSLALSPYPVTDLVIDSLFLLLVVLLFYFLKIEHVVINKSVKNIFYFGSLIGIGLSILFHYQASSLLYVFGSYDKNYFGVVLFCFFAWCWFEKKYFGVIALFLFSFFLLSRAFQMMIVIFIVWQLCVRFLLQKNKDKNEILKRNVSPVAIFCIFLVMLFGMIGFSQWWSNSVVGEHTVSSALRVSLNDTSNAIRFNSNVYAVKQITDDSDLILYGYDSDLVNIMNIGDPLSDEGSLVSSASYNGYRVVQPHHAVLNMLLKHGLIFSFVYFAILSIVLSRYFNLENASVWVPYFITAMIMHSTLTAQYLFLFMISIFCFSESRVSLNDTDRILKESA